MGITDNMEGGVHVDDNDEDGPLDDDLVAELEVVKKELAIYQVPYAGVVH